MKRLVILLACIGFCFCGKDDNPAGPQPNNDIFPLAIGNYWNYEIVYYNDQGYEASRDTIRTSVVDDTLIDGERWFQLANNDNPMSGLCINRSDGFWAGGPTGYLEFKYPAREGEQYTTMNQSTMTVEDDSNVVHVAAGEFTCVSYVANVPNRYAFGRAKLSPGTGLILEESWGETNDNQLYLEARSQLQSYSVH
jgi:hypothetical protein